MPLLYTDPLFQEHRTGRHPESPQRLKAIDERLRTSGLIERLTRGTIRSAQPHELTRIHTPSYIDEIRRFAEQGGGQIDSDTVVSPRSYEVALHAAGTAVAAVDAVMKGPERVAVCLVRPPGHHALAQRAMGFCLFNNVAVAARHAQQAHGLSRVLIVDWDVHHGNGTQDVFYDDGSVCFFSAHRHPFYPGTGAANETGSGAGLGATFNLPLRFGITRQEYRERFTTMLTAAADHCRPELVLISAGFDAHAADPIGSLGLESEDFETLTALVQEVANRYCGGKLVSLLEGGYNVRMLAESVEGHLRTLLNQ